MARLGRRERARRKKRHRTQRMSVWCSAWGAGTSFAKLGRKKWLAHCRVSRGRFWWTVTMPNVERIA